MAEPDWLRLQKKIFGRYIQQKLREGGIKSEIKNVIDDLKSGSVLLQLMEVLSGKTYGGKKLMEPKSRIQSIDNVGKVTGFIKECGLNIQTSNEDIVDGNAKFILGMLFQIIIKYMKIEDEDGNEGTDVKEALMLWLKNRTAGYSNVSIDNFTKSFHDGMAFNALLHKLRPKLIDYGNLNPVNKLENLTQALKAADDYANIDQYVEPSDIAKMDEVSMIVYLSDWYYGINLLQKQDIAAKRIGKLVLMTELHDKMRADYVQAATDLNNWSTAKITELNDHNFANSVEGVQAQIDEFHKYKASEKSEKLGQLLDTTTLFDNLAVRLANNKRPAYNPGAELMPDALEKKFEEVDSSELERSKALHSELARQIEIINDGICKDFADAVKAFQDWLGAKKTAVKGNKDMELEAQLEALNNSANDNSQYDGLMAEIKKHDERIKARSISNNKFTPLTVGDCEAMWTQYEMVFQKKQELLKGQIEDKKKAGLTEEQLQEIKDNFDYFDKDKTGFLERRELRACLKSLGEDATPKDIDEVLKKYDVDSDGNIKFTEFQQLMMTKLGDNDSKDEIMASWGHVSYGNEVVKPAHLSNLINDISWKQRHVDYLTKEMKPKGDGLDYATWTDEVFAR